MKFKPVNMDLSNGFYWIKTKENETPFPAHFYNNNFWLGDESDRVWIDGAIQLDWTCAPITWPRRHLTPADPSTEVDGLGFPAALASAYGSVDVGIGSPIQGIRQMVADLENPENTMGKKLAKQQEELSRAISGLNQGASGKIGPSCAGAVGTAGEKSVDQVMEEMDNRFKQEPPAAKTSCPSCRWRPIETAPKNYTPPILVTDPEIELVAIGRWFEKEKSICVTTVLRGRLGVKEIPNLTHWQPIPEPPA